MQVTQLTHSAAEGPLPLRASQTKSLVQGTRQASAPLKQTVAKTGFYLHTDSSLVPVCTALLTASSGTPEQRLSTFQQESSPSTVHNGVGREEACCQASQNMGTYMDTDTCRQRLSAIQRENSLLTVARSVWTEKACLCAGCDPAGSRCALPTTSLSSSQKGPESQQSQGSSELYTHEQQLSTFRRESSPSTVGRGVGKEEASKTALGSANTIEEQKLSTIQRGGSPSTVGMCVGREEACCKTSAEEERL